MAKWQIIVCIILLLLVAALVVVFIVCTSKYLCTYNPSNETFNNPFIGYAPMADNPKKLPESTLRYCGITWRQWEPEEGKFDTEALEKEFHLNQYRLEGVHLVLRFICDYPEDEAHRDIPDWLYEKTGDGVDYDIDYGRGYSPNYENKTFIQAHANAVRALGEYLGKDNFVAYVELGSLGHWGEWHVKYSDGLPRIPRESIRALYVEPWKDAFPNAEILMRRPFTHAKNNGFGVYNDMTGHLEDTNEWLDWIAYGGTYSQANESNTVVAMPNVWNTAPVGGEFTSSISMEKMLTEDLDITLSLIRKSHMTFIGPKVADITYQDGFDAVLKSVGYRLMVESAEVRRFFGKNSVILSWTNNGAAPLYQNLPVYLILTDPDGKEVEKVAVDITLRDVLPGTAVQTETFFQTGNLDKKLKKEGYGLKLGIVDPLTGKASVRLAQDGVYADGYNVLFG